MAYSNLKNKKHKKNRKKKRSNKKNIKVDWSKYSYYIIFCLKIFSYITFVGIISLMFIFAHDYTVQCNYFKTKSIKIEKNNRLSNNEILKYAKIYQGINIFKANLAIIEKRLITHPWIKEVSVRRDMPSRITITINEHSPVAIIKFGEDKFLLNKAGDIFKKYDKKDENYIYKKLPLIEGLKLTDVYNCNKDENIAYSAVMDILKLGQQKNCVLSNRIIDNIHVDKNIGLTIYSKGQGNVPSKETRTIKLGYNNYKAKYKRLEKILAYTKVNEHGFTDFDLIDLNNLNFAVVRPL